MQTETMKIFKFIERYPAMPDGTHALVRTIQPTNANQTRAMAQHVVTVQCLPYVMKAMKQQT
jgi:hypothetical protein